MPAARLETGRLLLRAWRAADLAPFAALNADPAVMEHFPATLTAARSAEEMAAIEAGFARCGYGLWAAELPGEAPFIGFIGLRAVPAALPFSPAIELGWRLARRYWGRGLAHEGARAAIGFAFGPAGARELLAYTAAANARSRALMGRLGMARDPAEDFEHPLLPAGHRLRPHVLHRLARPSG